MVRVELSQRKKHRNKSEWRNIPTATCCGITLEGDGPKVGRVIKAAIDAGHDCSGDVYVYRDGTLCFRPISVERWLSGKQFSGKQPEHLRRAQNA
jgi:hypothetical protein